MKLVCPYAMLVSPLSVVLQVKVSASTKTFENKADLAVLLHWVDRQTGA